MSKMNKKLSVKTLGFDKETINEIVSKDKSKSHELAVFYGQMTRLKKGEMQTPDGEVRSFVGLRGIFKGVNLIDKSEGASSVCYLPDVALDLIQGQWAEGDRIEFAVKIFARYNKPVTPDASPYVFEAEFLTEVSNDPLSALEKIVQDKVPQLSLAAPKKEKVKAA